jgi:hypothetical protein
VGRRAEPFKWPAVVVCPKASLDACSKNWGLDRVNSVGDSEEGMFIGKYQGRGDATKIIKQVAYQPELRRR